MSQNFEMKCFLTLLNYLKVSKNEFITNTPSIRQSSVAIIFRLNPNLKMKSIAFSNKILENNKFDGHPHFINYIEYLETYLKFLSINLGDNDHLFEMLLIKRSNNINDRHKGQLAFPGGKCEENETDYLAVQREVHEEIGISLNNPHKYIPLGKITLNSFAYYHEEIQKSTWISAFIFYEIQENNFKLNSDEVEKILWVAFPNLWKISSLKREIDFSIGHNYFFQNKLAFVWFKKLILKNFESRIYKVLYFKEYEEKLYGITFNIILYILGRIRKEGLILYRKEDHEDFKELNQILRKGFECKYFIKRKNGKGYSRIKGAIATKLFYINRVKQFLV